MSHDLPKAYDPSTIEERWAEYWVRERLFDTPTPVDTQDAAKKFTMLLPPPNVTGRLHMGHMLNQTEMDILTRWHRMSGSTAVWVPGTDHAGIATQMMVERQLAAEHTCRKQLGREGFVDRVWQWKHLYGNAILDQMKRLGASVDWSREYFTMDERLSPAVREAFVRLYEQGLIYRGAYIVNWDPQLQTAVSDLEVDSEERPGKLFHVHYPRPDGTHGITIATTRPETMLGDVAIAVNPADERYQHLIGQEVIVPLTLDATSHAPRRILILADDWAKPEFGTGAVKVTPAHDPNDFAIGQRHNLPQLSIFDETARVSCPGSPYQGLDRFAARERIVEDLKAGGFLEKVEEHTHAVPISQRTGAVIEPRLSMQWFVAVNKTPASGGNTLAANAAAAVRDGHIKFTPDQYRKTYEDWMGKIYDWCISRQLWWGHRIPAWHCALCAGITVARETPATCQHCASSEIAQETDVLDTWFSSGLLPFTVFGWPGEQGKDVSSQGKEVSSQTKDSGGVPLPLSSASPLSSLFPLPSPLTPDLAAFYPTDLLVTGFDILFFWVARMIMLGTHFMLDVPLPDGSPRSLADAVPFRTVYIHALVRDADRQKMSKTKGNVIDPIDIIGRFGTDAVRFTLASMASPGTDIAFSEARTEGNRAFANKIWNAARFLFMNIDRAAEAGITVDLSPDNLSRAICNSPLPIAGWISARLNRTVNTIHDSLNDYRFDLAADAIYQFFWGDFCDWYIEAAKVRLNNDTEIAATKKALLTNVVAVFEVSLRLLSPFMPFITEELWEALYGGNTPAKSIALASYPGRDEFISTFTLDESGESIVDRARELVTVIRSLRRDFMIPDKELVPVLVHMKFGNPPEFNVFTRSGEFVQQMTRASSIEFTEKSFSGANARSTPDFDVAVIYARQIDIPAERERLAKDLAKYEKGLAAANRQLSNDAFTAKAPLHIIDGLRKQAAETQLLYDKARAALDALPPA